ncbi:hypothetical protein FQN54_003348 [Arachnomyces sp. PD_36]|nr:hypothetical protein FQN54_003348 [Arachnomyces sp. PD_36]
MEIADPSESAAAVGPHLAVDPALTNGEDPFANNSVMDDDRSSSLSEIDEDQDHSSPISHKLQAEIDSEAETERIDESPNLVRTRKDIVVSAGGYENSPSKLAQSTTYEDINVDDETPALEDSPSKPSRSTKSNGVDTAAKEPTPTEADDNSPASLESAGTKRKRSEAEGDSGNVSGDDDRPARKRRGSATSNLPGEAADEASLPADNAEELPEGAEPSNDGTPVAEEAQDNEARPAPTKGRKGKKGKRKGKKAKDFDDEQADRDSRAPTVENGQDEANEAGEEAGEADNNAKAEEEYAKKTSAMDTLVSLERQFANLRDRVYDERIAKLNNELAELNAPTPTHADYLRQLQCVEEYRDAKMKHEQTLFAYKLQSLRVKSQAERSQIHSSFFQHVRDVRQHHLGVVGEHFYRNQHDRFKAENNTPHYTIPFPTRRSQQISQQNAYNKEISILSGAAKYVGFPAAPTLEPARPQEIEEDFEKMGISTQAPVSASQPQPSLTRGNFISSQSLGSRPGAEEEFLEQTPWANPQHPIHQQHLQQQIQQHTLSEQPRATSFTTPAAQRRAVDVNAPNGSASTIPENMSNANSSAANTPYGTEQERARLHGITASGADPHHTDLDATDRNSGFRSQSSSPLEVRKSRPSNYQTGNPLGRPPSLSQPQEFRQDGTSSAGAPKHSTSSSSSRLGLFNNSPTKQERSPQIPAPNSDVLSSRQRSSPLASMHQSAGITAGASRMAAR